METGVTKGTRVWMKHKDFDFETGEVIELNDEELVTVEVNGETTSVKWSQLELRNPRHLEETDDLTQLSYLNTPSILFNLKQRYARQTIYTYSGTILIAVNPFQKLSIYSKEMIDAHKGQGLENLAPHVFAIADNSYGAMLREEKSQSILVSGESGAGKTETTKYLLQYFAEMSKPLASTNHLITSPDAQRDMLRAIEKKVLQSTPLLEAFGNAKTQRNDNSSRFGKFIDVKFHPKAGTINGAVLRTYLLEKSRVGSQIERERNYHIFYQLLAGSSVTQLQEWKIGNPQDYHYLNQTGCIEIKGVNDAKMFEQTKVAMNTIGITNEQQNLIFSLIAGILHLGNLKFVETQASDKSDATKIENEDLLPIISKLLFIDAKGLKQALLTREMVAVNDKYVVPLTPSQSIAARDALAMTVYSKIFDWLVLKINESLALARNTQIETLSIAILDISGFESFDANGFEQFCINYANEKLQQQFNHHVFKLEQQEYIQEKIDWSVIAFTDNQECLDLIEKKNSMCILELLDEESKLAKSTESTFATKLYGKHLNHKHFVKPRFLKNGFGIIHYAGEVVYDSQSFIEKNRDFVVAELLTLLEKSQEDFVKNLIKSQEKEIQPKSRSKFFSNSSSSNFKFVSVSSQFRESLNELMGDIGQTSPHYIRCIRPNSSGVPKEFVNDKVLLQLRCGGVMEAIRIKKQGFPARPTFEHFYQRYSLLYPLSKKSDMKEKCKEILDSGKIDPSNYLFGMTKIFFKIGQLELLEKYRMIKIHKSATVLQKHTRRWNQVRKYKSLKQATLVFQSACRKKLAIQEMWRLKKNKAGILLLSVLRGWVQRKKFLQLRNAAIVFQSKIRSHISKKSFKNLHEFQAVVRLQALIRGRHIRNMFIDQRQSIFTLQCAIRRFHAEKTLTELRIQARSIAKVKAEKEAMEQRVREMEQAVEEERIRKEQLHAAEQQLAQQVQQMNELHQTTEETLKKTQSRVEELEKELMDIREEKAGVEESLKKSVEEEKKLRNKSEESYRMISQQVVELKKVIKQQEGQIHTLEETKDSLEKQGVVLERNIKSLKEQMESESSQLKQQLENETNEKQKLQDSLESLKMKLNESKEERKKLEDQVSQLQGSNEEMKIKIERLEERLSLMTTTQENADQKYAENEVVQQQKYDQLRKQMKEQINEWKKKAKNTQTELELIQLERDELKDHKSDLETRLEQSKRKLQDLKQNSSNKMDEQMQQRYELEEKVNEMSTRLRESEEKGRKFQAKIVTLTGTNDEWKSKYEHSEETLLNLQQEMVKLENEKKDKIRHFENQLVSEKEQANNELESTRTSFEKQVKELKEQLQNLESDLENLTTNKKELSDSLSQLTSENEQYKLTNQELLEEKQSLLLEVNEWKEKSNASQKSLEELTTTSSSQNQTQLEQIQSLEETLTIEKEQHQTVLTQNLQLQKELKKTQMTLSQVQETTEKETKDYRERLKKEKESFIHLQSSTKKEIEQLKQLLQEEQLKNAELEKKVSSVQRKVHLLVLDPKISEQIKKEEPDFAKAVITQIPSHLEARFAGGVPSPAYLSFLYLQYCKTIEVDSSNFINHFLGSLQKAIFNNLNNDQALGYWLSMTTALFFLVAKDNEWTESIEFPKEEGEPTEQIKKLYIRPDSNSQLMLGLIEYIITIYYRLTKKIVSLLDAMIVPAFLEKSTYSKQEKPSPTVETIFKLLKVYITIFRDNLISPDLVSSFFGPIFSFIQAKIFNALILRKDLCNIDRTLHIKMNIKLFQTLCQSEGVQWLGHFEESFSKIGAVVDLMMHTQKNEITASTFPQLNATQIKRILVRISQQEEYSAPISDEVYSRLEAAIQPNESLLLTTLQLKSLTVDALHYILPDDILSVTLAQHFHKFSFTFFEKKIQSIVSSARG